MKRDMKGISTTQGIIVAIVVIVIIAGAGAWYFTSGDGDGGPANGDGNGNGDGGQAPAEIKIGWPVPVSGPISPFGEPDQWVADTMEEYLNEDGGIMLSEYDEKVPVNIIVRDTESSPKTAATVAETLATKEQVDMFLVMHTPDTTVPVCGVAEKHGMPTVSLDTPMEAWLQGAPYEWCYHTFWTVKNVGEAFQGTWDKLGDRTNKVVGGLWPDGPDGRSWKNIQMSMWEEEGYEVVFPGHFPKDLQDFSSIISEFQQNDVEIVTGTVPTPTFHRFINQCVEANYNPPVVTVGKANLFPSAMEALGDLSEGCTQELWWSPHHPFESSLTGESTQELANSYEEGTGKQWTPPLGYAYAGLEIAVDSIKRAGTVEPEALRQAIANTDLETVIGPVNFKESPGPDADQEDIVMQYKDHVSISPVVMSQWVPGDEWPWEQEIVYNYKYDDIPETADLMFPKPW